jgi:hypothetical protein
MFTKLLYQSQLLIQVTSIFRKLVVHTGDVSVFQVSEILESFKDLKQEITAEFNCLTLSINMEILDNTSLSLVEHQGFKS